MLSASYRIDRPASPDAKGTNLKRNLHSPSLYSEYAVYIVALYSKYAIKYTSSTLYIVSLPLHLNSKYNPASLYMVPL